VGKSTEEKNKLKLPISDFQLPIPIVGSGGNWQLAIKNFFLGEKKNAGSTSS
jgi:hypothetical protein